MKLSFVLPLLLSALTLSSSFLSTPVESHTWLSCTHLSDPNNRDSECLGYMRGYAGRPAGFDVDNHYTNRVFGWNGDAAACGATQRSVHFQDQQKFPRAKVVAGETVATTYMSNGHVNKDNPLTQSTATFYWTGDTNKQITKMSQLTPDSRLAPLQNYDDCVCGEGGGNPVRSKSGANLPCMNWYTIPPNTPPGVYQIVWYWSYDKHFAANDNKEEYTSCFDVEVIGMENGQCKNPASPQGTMNNGMTGPNDDKSNGFSPSGKQERPKLVSQGTKGVGSMAKKYGLGDIKYPNQHDICPDKAGGSPFKNFNVPARPSKCGQGGGGGGAQKNGGNNNNGQKKKGNKAGKQNGNKTHKKKPQQTTASLSSAGDDDVEPESETVQQESEENVEEKNVDEIQQVEEEILEQLAEITETVAAVNKPAHHHRRRRHHRSHHNDE